MRQVINFDHNWYFQKENTGMPETLPEDWEVVDLPHTWNGVDGQDGRGDYHRGTCWYAKSFRAPKRMEGSRVYVESCSCPVGPGLCQWDRSGIP
ncbi:MAG: hypothetical protein ACLRMZ_13405 [Blautia marasmi]